MKDIKYYLISVSLNMGITYQKFMVNLDIIDHRKLLFFYNVTIKIILVPVPGRVSAFIL